MKLFFKFIIGIFITLLLSEAGLRLVDHYAHKYAPGNEKGVGIQALAMRTFVQGKINSLWIRGREARESIFEPPFDVFVNKDFNDEARLRFILQYSSLPKNINQSVENFLRLNNQKENEIFTVTSNSFGFRGKERTLDKPKNTYRIMLLGSYPAFGHAVNDNETYATILEDELNNHYQGKKKFEIWNGGKQGATSIMGYARLKEEVLGFNPDLIVWDYGWIELYLGRDMVRQEGKRVELKNLNWAQRQVIKVCTDPLFDSLELCKFSLNKMTKVSYTDAIDGWKESMTLLREWGKKNNLPVIFLRHKGVTIPANEYQAFNNPANRMYFIDTTDSILGTPPNEEEKNLFWSKENWLSELNYKRADVEKSDAGLIFLGDAIQYNRIGYKRIGLFLASELIKKDMQF